MFNHHPKGFGERQQLIEEIVSPPEADDINDPHPLETEGNITPLTCDTCVDKRWQSGPTSKQCLHTHPPLGAVCGQDRVTGLIIHSFLINITAVDHCHIPMFSAACSVSSSSSSSSSVTKSSMFSTKPSNKHKHQHPDKMPSHYPLQEESYPLSQEHSMLASSQFISH